MTSGETAGKKLWWCNPISSRSSAGKTMGNPITSGPCTTLILSYSDDDDNPDCEEDTSNPCDLSLYFSSWEALQAAKDIPELCMPMYAMQVLMDTLNTALQNYTDVNNGYDEKFGYYVKYLRDMVPESINAVIKDNGKYVQCSQVIKGGWSEPRSCFIPIVSDAWTVKYTFVDEQGFYDELQSKYGIQRDWVEVSDVVNEDKLCTPNPRSGGIVCHNIKQTNQNIPHAKADFTIPNPKDSIADALPRFQALQRDVVLTWADLSFFLWDGDGADAVEALSTPVFMLLQAVESMATVKAIGEKEKEKEDEEKKNLIITIISAVLLIFPFAGEIVGSVAGVAWITDAALLADVTANLALAGYDIVTNPKSAPMDLLNILFSGTGRTGANLAKVASVRRGIKADDLAKFGSVFKENDDLLQGLIRVCKT